MKYVNPIFSTKNIKTFLSDLIHDYDCDSYTRLSYSDKYKFVSLLLEALNNDYEFLIESDDFASTMEFFKKTLCGTHEDDENFLDAMKELAVKYYEQTMKELFDDALMSYHQARHEWTDHVGKYGDPDQAYDTYREQLSW